MVLIFHLFLTRDISSSALSIYYPSIISSFHSFVPTTIHSRYRLYLWSVGLPRVLEYYSRNYSSNFLLLEYLLISISGCKIPFPVAVFFAVQAAVNWWIVGIYGNLGLRGFICNLPAWALIKYKVKKSRLFKEPDPSGPGTLTHHPLFVIGSLY